MRGRATWFRDRARSAASDRRATGADVLGPTLHPALRADVVAVDDEVHQRPHEREDHDDDQPQRAVQPPGISGRVKMFQIVIA